MSRRWYVAALMWTVFFIPLVLGFLYIARNIYPDEAVGLGSIGLAYKSAFPATLVAVIGAIFTTNKDKFLAAIGTILGIILLIATVTII